MVTKHVLGLGACLIGTGLLVGCGSDAPDKQGDAQVTWPGAEQAQARVGGGRLRRVATYEAAYTAKTGGFSFKQAAPKYLLPGGQKPQGFKFDAASAFTFATPNAQVGPGAPLTCVANQLCGSVTVQYNDAGGGNKVDDVWAEIRDLVEPGVSVSNSNSIPAGYSPTIGYGQGRFKYGTLTSGAAATAKQWNFNLGAPFDPVTQDFYFNVDVYATYIHQSYSKGGTTGVDVDACAGGTVALNSGNGNNSTTTVSLPFPLTIYEKTGASTAAWVSSNGVFGVGTAAPDGFNESLPSTTFNASDGTVFAFWDQLNITAGGQVCYQTSGSAPNRTFTVTWKGMDIAASAPVESMNFSIIAYEGTDVVDFQYSEPSTGVSTDTQGAGSTAGLQGPVGGALTSIQLWSDAVTLPAAGSYPAGFRISPNLFEPAEPGPRGLGPARPACTRTTPMNDNREDKVKAQDDHVAPARPKRPYEPPRIEKKRSVARVTLLSGMGAMGVGVVSTM